MFWNPDHEDAIQQTHLLTQSVRSKDEALRKNVLDAERYGQESWEM